MKRCVIRLPISFDPLPLPRVLFPFCAFGCAECDSTPQSDGIDSRSYPLFTRNFLFLVRYSWLRGEKHMHRSRFLVWESTNVVAPGSFVNLFFCSSFASSFVEAFARTRPLRSYSSHRSSLSSLCRTVYTVIGGKYGALHHQYLRLWKILFTP